MIVAAGLGIVALVRIVGTSTASPAATITFPAVADTYSAQDARATNYGTDTKLLDDNASGQVHRSYLRFSVSGIPTGATVNSVSLRMTAVQASSATANVKVVTGAWTETGLTYTNAPAYDSTAIANGTPSPIAAGPVTFDVSGVVKGNGTWDLVLTQTQAAQTVWSSREGTAPPQLIVTYTPSAAATPTATATATPTATASATPTNTPTATAGGGPCMGTAPPVAGYTHVVWILEENEAQSSISSSNMPYMTGLAGKCGRTTNYEAITHPSLPNYIALTSGSTQAITDDNGPSSHPLSADSIFHQLGGNVSTADWTGLEDGMQSNCALSSGGTDYAVKHNPAVYYSSGSGNVRTACGSRDVPYNSSQAPDLSTAFTFITPNSCHDGHDPTSSCGGTSQLTNADNWLKVVVPKILDSTRYQAGNTVLIVTFDEGSGSNQTVYTTVVAPSVVPGTVSGAAFTHYSLLRTTEELLGLPLIGEAADAPSMRQAFHLG